MHWFLGLGISREGRFLDNMLVMGSNPFQNTVYQLNPDGVACKVIRMPCNRCRIDTCNLLTCCLTIVQLPQKHIFWYRQVNQILRIMCDACYKIVWS